MSKYIVIGLIVFFVISCNTYEQLGARKYKTRVERIFVDDLDSMIMCYKGYYWNKKENNLLSYALKAQRLGAEKKTDTIFVKGILEEHSGNKIITKKFYINGYENKIDTDSIIKIFFQKEDGSFFLKNVKEYRKGKVVKQYDF